VNEARGWSRIRWVQSIPQDTTGIFGTNGNSVVGINGPNPYPCFALQDFANGQGRFNTTYLTDIGTRRGCRTLRLLVPTALWPVQAGEIAPTELQNSSGGPEVHATAPQKREADPIADAFPAPASGSVQTALSKALRPEQHSAPAHYQRGAPDRDLSFFEHNTDSNY
jgi:hypothetical protein